MNLSIYSKGKPSQLAYQMELELSSFYYDTHIQLKGEFGSIKLQKVDFPDCHTWLAHYQLSQSIFIKGSTTEPILQLYFPITEGFEDQLKGLEDGQKRPHALAIYFTYASEPAFLLESTLSRFLVVQYGPSYFTADQHKLLESLMHRQESTGNIFSTAQQVIPDPTLLQVLHQIISYPVEDAYLPRYLKAKTEELLVHFLKHTEQLQLSLQQFTPKELEDLQQAIAILKAGYGERLSYFQLAKRIGMNAYTLKKKFKAYTGYTIPEYQLNVRMERADQLLMETDLPVGEIGQQIGYKNLSNFSETFKKHFGISPKARRKKVD